MFDIVWNKEINEWVFRSALIVTWGDPEKLNRVVMHESCYEVLEGQISLLNELDREKTAKANK